MQTALAERAVLVGQRALILCELRIIAPSGTISLALAIGTDDTARPPVAHLVADLEMSHSIPHRGGRQNFLAEGSSAQRCPASYPPAAA